MSDEQDPYVGPIDRCLLKLAELRGAAATAIIRCAGDIPPEPEEAYREGLRDAFGIAIRLLRVGMGKSP